jgi:transaldolase/glucose-6-phosphate isomerase
MNPLKELQNHGQSVWLDNIRRGMILSGELKKLIDQDGLRGMTSNPTIFEKAISAGGDYDQTIRELVAQKKSVTEIFDAISIKDVQMAADVFQPVYEETQGADGYVSIEVAPHLARDTEGTVEEARRLWTLVGRSNAFIKIPATKEGLPAIERSLYEGININVTLIFSLERYKEVMEAYRSALERRSKEGKSLNVSSVASFFVSRIDTAVDKLLQERIHASQSPREKDMLLELLGKVAIANAKMAYQLFKKTFAGSWFEPFKKKGARLQRPLWASTGTKNPHYSDVLYVEELIGPNTVNTLPPATLEAFRDHGKPRLSLEEKVSEAAEVLEKLHLIKVDLRKITEQIETEGVKLFADSYDKLMAGLTAKRNAIEKELSAAKF